MSVLDVITIICQIGAGLLTIVAFAVGLATIVMTYHYLRQSDTAQRIFGWTVLVGGAVIIIGAVGLGLYDLGGYVMEWFNG